VKDTYDRKFTGIYKPKLIRIDRGLTDILGK